MLGFFVPSGGGKWLIERLRHAGGERAEGICWRCRSTRGQALPNLINLFWLLSLPQGLKASDIVGYTFLQFAVCPGSAVLLWALAGTLTYMPPAVPLILCL